MKKALKILALEFPTGNHRIKSKFLPVCDTPEECQSHLDAYAARMKWSRLNETGSAENPAA